MRTNDVLDARPGPGRPVAALWMAEQNPAAVFTVEDRSRIDDLVRLVQDHPVDPDAPASARLLSDVEVLISGWGAPRLDAAQLEQLPRLRAIVHAAGTVKTFVDADVFDRGIHVSTAARANAMPVARFTLAAIIFGLKRVPRFTARVQNSGMNHRSLTDMPALGRERPVIGVVGASRVGRRLVELLGVFPDAEILLADPYLAESGAAALGGSLVDVDELCRRSDVVTVHAPDTPETRRMIAGPQLAAMRDGALLINTARGGLIDTEALTAELVSGRIDAYLDVTDPEPLPADSPLTRLPNVVLTPHIAGALGEEATLLGRHAVQELERFVLGHPFRDSVSFRDLARVA